MSVRERLYLTSVIVFIGLGIFTVFTMRGEVAGLAALISLFFSGMAAGASLAAFRAKKRKQREESGEH